MNLQESLKNPSMPPSASPPLDDKTILKNPKESQIVSYPPENPSKLQKNPRHPQESSRILKNPQESSRILQKNPRSTKSPQNINQIPIAIKSLLCLQMSSESPAAPVAAGQDN